MDARATKGVSGLNACCECGGGLYSGTEVAIPAPVEAEPEPTTTTMQNVSEPAPAPPPPSLPVGLPQTTFVQGTQDDVQSFESAQPLYAGLFTLQQSLVPEVPYVSMGIYKNIHDKYLYWSPAQNAWFMGPDDRMEEVVAYQVPSSARSQMQIWQNPADDTLWKMDVNGQFLAFRISFVEGEACNHFYCSCPSTSPCKLDVQDVVCDTNCSVSACCDESVLCEEWSLTASCPDFYDLDHNHVCERGGCSQEQCCHPTCVTFACDQEGRQHITTRINSLCPSDECTLDFCCLEKGSDGAGPAPTPGSGDGGSGNTEDKPELVDCTECTQLSTEIDALMFNFTMVGVAYDDLVMNTNLWARCDAALKAMTTVLVGKGLKSSQVFTRSFAGSNETLVIVLPGEADFGSIRAELQAVRKSKLAADIGTALKAVDGFSALLTWPEFKITAVTPILWAKVINSETLSRESGKKSWLDLALEELKNMWTALRSMASGAMWYILGAAALLVLVGLAFYTWLHYDNEEHEDVVG